MTPDHTLWLILSFGTTPSLANSADLTIQNDPALKALTAVQEGRVYGVLPYNWYTKNYGSILANAYFIGKILYAERFKEVDPVAKADEIYQFLVGKPVFKEMDAGFKRMALTPSIPVTIPPRGWV